VNSPPPTCYADRSREEPLRSNYCATCRRPLRPLPDDPPQTHALNRPALRLLLGPDVVLHGRRDVLGDSLSLAVFSSTRQPLLPALAVLAVLLAGSGYALTVQGLGLR
jgi:hypothetical protein